MVSLRSKIPRRQFPSFWTFELSLEMYWSVSRIMGLFCHNRFGRHQELVVIALCRVHGDKTYHPVVAPMVIGQSKRRGFQSSGIATNLQSFPCVQRDFLTEEGPTVYVSKGRDWFWHLGNSHTQAWGTLSCLWKGIDLCLAAGHPKSYRAQNCVQDANLASFKLHCKNVVEEDQ